MRGLSLWFDRMGYNVGLDIKKFDSKAEEKLAEKLLGFVSTVLPSGGMHFLVTAGAEADALFQALLPFIGKADIVASKVKGGAAIVPLILFADDLSPEEVSRRLDELLEIAEPLNEFGPRLNFQSQGSGHLYPLVIHFDRAKHDAMVAALLDSGFRYRFWSRVYLRAGFLCVPHREVRWAEKTGLASVGESIAEFFGSDSDLFDFTPADVDAVQLLASGKHAPQEV